MVVRRVLSGMLIAGLVAVALFFTLGFRVHLPSASVPLPAPDASAEQVVASYLDAYNARDFGTARDLYPGSGGYSRIRAMGTFEDVRPTRLLAEDGQGLVRRVTSEQSQTLVWVMVSYTASGFSDSDRAVVDGPSGTGYKLARSDERHPWRIIDSGTP